MKKLSVIYLLVCLVLIAEVLSLDQVYVLKLLYDNGKTINEGIRIKELYYNEVKGQLIDGYTLELVSFKNKVLYTQKFHFQLDIEVPPLKEWFDEKGNQIYFPKKEETRIILDSSIVEIIFPYFKEAKIINIYDPNNIKVLEIDISSFSEYKSSDKQISILKINRVQILIFILSGLFFTSILIFLLVKYNKKSENKLQNYIRLNFKKGYTKAQIKQALLKPNGEKKK